MDCYSLDTNLVIPLINSHDHNHGLAISILKRELRNGVICTSVIEETKIVFRDRLNKIIGNCLSKLIRLKTIKEKIERDQFILNVFNDLSQNDPYLADFYKLIYQQITQFIAIKPIEYLPGFLSTLIEHYTRIIIPTIKGKGFGIITWDHNDKVAFNKIFDIKKVISSIRFKDEYDKSIFHELAAIASIEYTIEFYTHDFEFSKKALIAIKKLINNINYAPSTLSFIYV